MHVTDDSKKLTKEELGARVAKRKQDLATVAEKAKQERLLEEQLGKINLRTAPKLRESKSQKYPHPSSTAPAPVRIVVQAPSPKLRPRSEQGSVSPSKEKEKLNLKRRPSL